MPLKRDKMIGYDRERLAFTFVMLNGNEPIKCRISDAARTRLPASEAPRRPPGRPNLWLTATRLNYSRPICSMQDRS
jgi:hypothetical protein